MNLDFRKLRKLERRRVRGTCAQGIQQVQTDLPDIVLLYRTLVPTLGFHRGSKRNSLLWDRSWSPRRNGSNMEAAVLLRQQKALGEKHAKEVKTSADQFLRAAEMPLRRYKSHLQRTLYAGPTARKDAEEKERARWVEIRGFHARTHSDAFWKDSGRTTR